MVKQSQGFTEDTEISKIIFFWARQRKLGKEISQINFFPPVQEKNKNENKNNYPGGGFQMFAGWEDKPLTSPQARSLLFSWDHALILKEGFWSESGQWFYFEQQNEHLRVGSGPFHPLFLNHHMQLFIPCSNSSSPPSLHSRRVSPFHSCCDLRGTQVVTKIVSVHLPTRPDVQFKFDPYW